MALPAFSLSPSRLPAASVISIPDTIGRQIPSSRTCTYIYNCGLQPRYQLSKVRQEFAISEGANLDSFLKNLKTQKKKNSKKKNSKKRNTAVVGPFKSAALHAGPNMQFLACPPAKL